MNGIIDLYFPDLKQKYRESFDYYQKLNGDSWTEIRIFMLQMINNSRSAKNYKHYETESMIFGIREKKISIFPLWNFQITPSTGSKVTIRAIYLQHGVGAKRMHLHPFFKGKYIILFLRGNILNIITHDQICFKEKQKKKSESKSRINPSSTQKKIDNPFSSHKKMDKSFQQSQKDG